MSVLGTTFVARNYQVELLEVALEENTIVCLGTGTGKTFIAVLLIKAFAYTVEKPISEGGQRIVFIVPSVALVEQQANNVKTHTSLKVGKYVGSMGVDFWDKKLWATELEKNEVVVMTAQILVNILNSGFIRLKDISLLVIDECHRAVKNHPYSQVMECFNHEAEHPHILGLTAAVLSGKCKPHKLKEKIRNLEVTLRSRCATTRDLASVEEYGTKPEEELLSYSSDEGIFDEIISTLSDCESLLKNAADVEGITAMIFKRLKKLMSDCSHVLYQMGQWAFHLIANSVCKYFEHVKTRGLIDIDDPCTEVLNVCEKKLKKSLEQCEQVTPPKHCRYIDHMFLSGKATTLLSYIEKAGLKAAEDNPFCAIVFVERRSTAEVLCELIKCAVQFTPNLAFVKPLWTVGAGGIALPSAAGSETGTSHHRQNLVLKAFRTKHCNLLVSTSATEEGLDIPSCSLVIQFDHPKEVRAYIQAKGRARRRDSKYVVMAEESQLHNVDDELEEFSAIEGMLAHMCIDRTMPNEEEVREKQTNLPVYSTRIGARVTMASSIELVNRYCDKLPGDHFTRLAPHCEVFAADEGGGFVAELMLPRNCPFKQSLKSDVWPSKMQAKQHVALLMCSKLHEMQQLDDHLCPIVDDESDSEDDSDDDADDMVSDMGKTVSRGNKKLYDMKIPTVLEDCRPLSGEPVYLYQIDIEPVEQPKTSISSHRVCLGILTAKPLPALQSFSLYPKSGIVSVTFRSLDQTVLSESLITKIDSWHKQLFKHTVGIGNSPSLLFDPWGSHRAYRIVPLFSTSSGSWDIDSQLLSGLHVQPKRCSPTEMVGCVVTKTYEVHKNQKQQFRVIRIRYDLKPSSEFPDKTKAPTYADYFYKQYGLKIKDMHQPLLEVETLSRKSNALVKVEKRSQTKVLQLVPELCDVDEWPADLWHDGLLLPSVLWRFEQLLVVQELRVEIAISASAGFSEMSSPPIKRKCLGRCGSDNDWVTVDATILQSGASSESLKQGQLLEEQGVEDTSDAAAFNFSTSKVLEEGKLIDGQEHEDASMPPLFEMLTAVTAKSSADSFNLERLEMLGDSFLKLAVSMSVFWDHSNKHEGQLSKKRSRTVSNANLFSLAKKKNLPAYMFVTAFKPSDMWLPPGFQHVLSAESGKSAETVQASYQTQTMSNKRVADSVEALIGVYLVHGGYSSALQFMKWIGIPVAPAVAVALGSPSKEKVKECIDVIASASFIQGNQKKAKFSSLYAKLSDLEMSIDYEFKDKRWLIQALTHPSFDWNQITDCYQRMEFLGDSIIDFLVTRTIFGRYPGLDPGKLTDLRSALVCNDMFAKIAVEQSYHRHLNALSPRLLKAINLYAQSQVEKTSLDIAESEMEIDVESDEEEVETPKVLGDLFESVAGAIFLDNGLNMEHLWRVYLPMLLPYIEKYGTDPPIQPVRQLYEMIPHGLLFSGPKKELDGAMTCTITLPTGKSFTASAQSNKLARTRAAKKAVRFMKSKVYVGRDM
jgi:endoribonuclease Dicer